MFAQVFVLVVCVVVGSSRSPLSFLPRAEDETRNAVLDDLVRDRTLLGFLDLGASYPDGLVRRLHGSAVLAPGRSGLAPWQTSSHREVEMLLVLAPSCWDAVDSLGGGGRWRRGAATAVLVLLDDGAVRCDVRAMLGAFHRSGVPLVAAITTVRGRVRLVSLDFTVEAPSSQAVFRALLAPRHGHPMRVSLLSLFPKAILIKGRLSGYDGLLLTEAARSLGMELRVFPATDNIMGTRMDNGTLTGAMADAAQGRVEVAGNARYLMAAWTDVLEFTYPHYKDNYCILVQKSGEVPPYMIVILPFTSGTWATSGVCFLLLAIVRFSLAQEHSWTGISKSILDTYKTIITGSIGYNPKSTHLRLFLITSIFFSVIMMNAFQGSMSSFLLVPKHLPEVNSLQEVREKMKQVYILPAFVKIFNRLENDDIMHNIVLSFVASKSSEWMGTLTNVSQRNDRALLSGEHVANIAMRMREFAGKLHLVRECALEPAYMGFAMHRFWVHGPKLSAAVQRMVQAGLPAKWRRDMLHQNILTGKLVMRTASADSGPTPLAVKHFQAAFFLLGVGLIAGSGVFVLEGLL